MRLFIALDLGDDARAAIAAEQTHVIGAIVAKGGSSPKAVPPERLHLTLVFLGEIDASLQPMVVAALEPPVAREPFTLTFGGIGVFPPRGKPSVLWLGVTGGAGEALAVQDDLANRMRRLGIALERRPFHPHLTLARWRDSRTADRPRALAAATAGAVARVHVDHATLYHSRLSSAGPAYSPVARATLSLSSSASEKT